MFESKAPTAGATLDDCTGASNASEGFVVGLGTATGNPCEIRVTFVPLNTPVGSVQPADVDAAATFCPDVFVTVVILVWQFSRKPGTLPAIAVTWKVDSVSN